MPSELSPGGSNVKMTKAQVKKYVADMKKAQKIAEEKIKQAQENGEFDKEKKEVEKLEDLLS